MLIGSRQFRSMLFVAGLLAAAALFAATVRPLPVMGGIVAAIVLLRIASMLRGRRRTVNSTLVTHGPVFNNSAARLPRSAIELIERR